METTDKTKEQLVKELEVLRQQVAELDKLEIEHKRAEEWEKTATWLLLTLGHR
jgi:hypothetical protein